MTKAKRELFDKELQSKASLFKALGHPARLAILRYLAETKTCVFGDISDELPLCKSTVNQHLKELKRVGLISGTVDGTKKNYCINPLKVILLEEIIFSFLEEIKSGQGDALKEPECRS